MEKSKEEKEITGFSWTTLFLVTGCSLFLFYFILKSLDGHRSPFFLYAGCIAAFFGFIGWISSKKTRNNSPS